MNIARMRAAASDPLMAGLVERIDEMNRLAEQSSGFVWRLEGVEATAEALGVFADYFQPFDPQFIFYNMSVWENVESLKAHAFKSAHSEMLREKAHWIGHFERAHIALWWIPAGRTPTIVESANRLRSVHERGPTEFAFTFKTAFPPPTEEVAAGVT